MKCPRAAATWIEIDPATNEEIVRGFANIEKARWKLVRSAPHLLVPSNLSSHRHHAHPLAEVPAVHRVARNEGCVPALSLQKRWTLAYPFLSRAVQCTKGKCIKAFHVTCALREESGVHMDATIPDEDGAGSISLLEQTRASTPVAEAASADASADASAAPAPAPPASPSKPALDNDQIRLSVLCRTHNPVRLRPSPRTALRNSQLTLGA